MAVVAPRDGWPNPRAVAMASGAGRLLDEARLHKTTADALADVQFVFATTARSRFDQNRITNFAGFRL